MTGVGVAARGLGLRGPRGWAFREVSFDAEPGSLIAIEGPSGSGRTCLLLALTGRMKPTEGSATVGGARGPKHLSAVRRCSALAHVPGVTDLDPALTVAEHLHERALLQRRFGDSPRELLRPRAERRGEARERIDAALAAAGLEPASLPKGARTAVRDLERVEALRLSVALALIDRPRLLGVDDTDLKLSDAERDEVWALLASLAEAGTTVVAVCSEAPEGAVVVSTAFGTGPDGTNTDGRSTVGTTTDETTSGGTTAGATNTGETATEDTETHGSKAEADEDANADDSHHDTKEKADALAATRRA
nr:ATP-binding cassette domain-containing protein [Streptomyces sp. TRM68367]